MNGEDKEQQLKEAHLGRRSDHGHSAGSAGRLFPHRPDQRTSCRFRCAFPARWWNSQRRAAGGRTQIDFIGQVQDETHAAVGNVRDNIKITLDQENKERAAKRIYQYDAGFTLEPGRYNMKFLVRENITGKMGTFLTRLHHSGSERRHLRPEAEHHRVEQPARGDEGRRGRGRNVRQERRGRESVDRRRSRRSCPTSRKYSAAARTCIVTFDVYDAQPDPKDAKARHVEVSMSLFNKAGAKAFEVGPMEMTQLAPTRGPIRCR